MSEKPEVRFEEAERCKGLILTLTAIFCCTLCFIIRYNTTLLSLMVVLTVYLLSGDRYQWIYITKKTFFRDILWVFSYFIKSNVNCQSQSLASWIDLGLQTRTSHLLLDPLKLKICMEVTFCVVTSIMSSVLFI